MAELVPEINKTFLYHGLLVKNPKRIHFSSTSYPGVKVGTIPWQGFASNRTYHRILCERRRQIEGGREILKSNMREARGRRERVWGGEMRELRHDLSSPRSVNAGPKPQALIPSSILIPPRFCVEQTWKEKKGLCQIFKSSLEK